MPRIKLAHWVGDHKPGDEIEVSDVELAALKRDGRVAEVVEAPGREPVVVAEATAETEPAQPEPEPEPEPVAETGRKRR